MTKTSCLVIEKINLEKEKQEFFFLANLEFATTALTNFYSLACIAN